MKQVTPESLAMPAVSSGDVLGEILKAGAQRLLRQAVEDEVAAWIDHHAQETDEHGRRQIVRHGYLPACSILTAVGPIEVTRPRVHDRRRGEHGVQAAEEGTDLHIALTCQQTLYNNHHGQ